jgi:hypothetical protein
VQLTREYNSNMCNQWNLLEIAMISAVTWVALQDQLLMFTLGEQRNTANLIRPLDPFGEVVAVCRATSLFLTNTAEKN